MPYSTHAQITTAIGEAELIQLSDRPERADPENAGTSDWTVIDDFVDRARRYIDSFIIAYLPLTHVPERFSDIEIAVARYFMHKDQPTEHVEKQFLAAKEYLEGIRDGRFSIGPDSSGVTDEKTAGDVDFASADTVFTGSNLHFF